MMNGPGIHPPRARIPRAWHMSDLLHSAYGGPGPSRRRGQVPLYARAPMPGGHLAYVAACGRDHQSCLANAIGGRIAYRRDRRLRLEVMVGTSGRSGDYEMVGYVQRESRCVAGRWPWPCSHEVAHAFEAYGGGSTSWRDGRVGVMARALVIAAAAGWGLARGVRRALARLACVLPQLWCRDYRGFSGHRRRTGPRPLAVGAAQRCRPSAPRPGARSLIWLIAVAAAMTQISTASLELAPRLGPPP